YEEEPAIRTASIRFACLGATSVCAREDCLQRFRRSPSTEVAAKFYSSYGCDNLPSTGFRALLFRSGAVGVDRGVVFEKSWSRSPGRRSFWHFPSRNADSAGAHRWIHLFDGFRPLRSAQELRGRGGQRYRH